MGLAAGITRDHRVDDRSRYIQKANNITRMSSVN